MNANAPYSRASDREREIRLFCLDAVDRYLTASNLFRYSQNKGKDYSITELITALMDLEQMGSIFCLSEPQELAMNKQYSTE